MKRYGSKIISVGCYIPEKIVRTSNLEKELKLKERFGLSVGLLERLTGCAEHHEIATPDLNASDLAVKASKIALKNANLPVEKIDMLIFAACCQDLMEPATANIVAGKLGIKAIPVLDIKNACNAVINSIDIADSLITTGKVRNVLITSGEIASKYVDKNIKDMKDFEQKAAGLTLGDAGSALIMIPKKSDKEGIIASSFLSDCSQWNLAVIYGSGTMYPRDPDKNYFLSDSDKIISLALELIPPLVDKTLVESGWKPEDVDLVIAHQATKKVIYDIMRVCEVPQDRAVITVDKYGNTAAATIPIVLNEALKAGRLRTGSRVLMVGGASGFSAGAITLVW